MGTRGSILIVEDETDIRELIALHLMREGYQVEQASTGEIALQKIQAHQFDLFVFDWMLPGMNGLELTRAVRAKATTPVLMVTAKAEPADIVLGLEGGADDYITKPFETPVLLARVRALLRRSAPKESTGASGKNELLAGSIRIDVDAHQAYQGGTALELTISEYRLLLALFQNQGKVLTRSKLVSMVQGPGVSVIDRTVDTHVFGLRKKLGEDGELIETVRGVGYRVK